MNQSISPTLEYLKTLDLDRTNERYLPTAFTTDPTLLEKINMLIYQLNQSNSLSNDVIMKWNEFAKSVDTVIVDKVNEILEGDLVRDLISTITDGLVQSVDELDIEMSSVKSSVTTHGTDIGTLKSDMNSVKTTNNTQSTDINTLKTDMSTVKSTNTTQTTDINTLKTDMSTAKSNITTQGTDINTLKTDMSTAKSTITTHGTDIGTLKTDMSTVKSTNTNQTTEINNLKTTTTNHTTNLTNINKSLNGITLNDMPTPYYMAHRGGMDVFPEGSIEAFKSCLAMGIKMIEMDVQLTADGSLVVNHDDTIDRTMNKTGNVSQMTTSGFMSGKITALPGWQGTPVLFEDLVQQLKNKVIYVVEIKKTNASQKLVDMILDYNLNNNVIIQSFILSDLDYALSKGLPCMFLTNNTNTTPSTVKAKGINYMGVSTNVTDAYITSCISANLKVCVYTVNKRHEVTRYLALGVHGFFSNDPLWASRKSPVLKKDTFNELVYTHGQQSPLRNADNFNSGDRGGFVAPNKFGWSETQPDFLNDFSMMGWAGELPTTFTFEGKLTLVKSGNTTYWGSFAFCTQTDHWDDSNASGLSNGYHLLLRESGKFQLYKRVGVTSTLLQELDTAVVPVNTTVPIKIIVSSTGITATRVDTNHSLTSTDTAYRKGYLHVGRRVSGILFHDLTLTY